jgi:hypothetical protein
MQIKVGPRISCDHKIEIIKEGAKILGASTNDQAQIAEALAQGEGHFGRLRSYRDAAIHCRVINAAIGIGLKVGRRATLSDVLLTDEALGWAYDSLIQLSEELSAAASLLFVLHALRYVADTDPDRPTYEAKKDDLSAQLRAHKGRRSALLPAPDFPSESELREAEVQWQQARQAEQMGWFRQLSEPQRPTTSPRR